MPPLRSRPTTTATSTGTVRRTAGAVSVALLTVGAAVTPAAAATDSRSYDFESLGAQDWPFRAINGFGAVNTAPAPPGGTGTAARFNVPADGTSFRAELALKGLSAESHRFAFANYLPKDWKQVDDDTIVAQWFSTQPGNEGVKPVVALSVHGGDWRLKVHWLKDLATFEEYETIIQLGAAQFGHWNRWALDITWSTPSTPGSITVTRDGVQVGAHRGDNNYHRGEPPHFRTGIYRPAWRPEKKSPPASGPDVVLYVDDIAITPVPAGAAAPATPPNTPTAPAPSAPPTPAKPTATTGPTPGPSPSTAASAPTASPSAAPAPVPTSAAPPSAVAAPTPSTTTDPSPAAPTPTPQDTLALAIDRPVPTTTKELSTTGTGAGVAVAFTGGTVAVVVGTFLIRRRKPGAHRRGSTPQD
ncbi:polysaccharide lyase [Kitasatospora purpeofusca]|uniref:polysaccharide lyase n=1 Tax=Kitasatospora purpeofusca TaxID=67352 RepID=UPI0030F24516